MKLRHLIAFAFVALLACGQFRQAKAATTILPPGHTCFASLSGTTGMVGLLGAITGGSGGITGTYGGVALTGGSGTGATANITVAGGVVTAVAVLNPGSQYIVGDILSAAAGNIGNVTGFSVPISSISLNGSLAGGSVSFYIPNTLTFKQTWQDSGQTILNQNPVQLDASGCMIAYGTGVYREIVKDSLGNTFYDALTTDTSAFNSVFWAGQAAGTPNVITINDVGFNGTDGSVIQFLANATNTGPTTINPSGFGAISVVKDTASGPVALTGGEIAITSSGAENVVSVVYSATGNVFHLLNLISAASTSNQVPLCGASGLKIINDTTLPNNKIDITANSVLMTTMNGSYINRSAVSTVVNFTTNGAGGLDTGAPAQATWYYIYEIDNGIAPSSLASLSLTPTMPSGYGYSCRIGAISTTLTTTNLISMVQVGQWGHWVGGSVAGQAPCNITTGAVSGSTYSSTSPVLVAVPVTGNGFCAPTTAVAVNLSITPEWKTGTTSPFIIAPSLAYSGTNNGPGGSNGVVPPIWNPSTSTVGNIAAIITLESSNLYMASSQNGFGAFLSDWKDSVNAN